MKKLILSVLTVLTAATGLIGVNGCGKSAKSTAVTPQTAIISDAPHQDFTIAYESYDLENCNVNIYSTLSIICDFIGSAL